MNYFKCLGIGTFFHTFKGQKIKYLRYMWQVNDDGLSSLLDVAELLGVRGLKSDRSQRHGSADPDPHQNVMDPEHWLK